MARSGGGEVGKWWVGSPIPISAPLRLCGRSSSPDEFPPAEAVVGVEAAVEDGV